MLTSRVPISVISGNTIAFSVDMVMDPLLPTKTWGGEISQVNEFRARYVKALPLIIFATSLKAEITKASSFAISIPDMILTMSRAIA